MKQILINLISIITFLIFHSIYSIENMYFNSFKNNFDITDLIMCGDNQESIQAFLILTDNYVYRSVDHGFSWNKLVFQNYFNINNGTSSVITIITIKINFSGRNC